MLFDTHLQCSRQTPFLLIHSSLSALQMFCTLLIPMHSPWQPGGTSAVRGCSPDTILIQLLQGKACPLASPQLASAALARHQGARQDPPEISCSGAAALRHITDRIKQARVIAVDDAPRHRHAAAVAERHLPRRRCAVLSLVFTTHRAARPSTLSGVCLTASGPTLSCQFPTQTRVLCRKLA